MPDYVSGANAAEEHDTIREGFDTDGGPQFSVVLRCAWADRYTVIGELLAGAVWPHNSLGAVCRRASSQPVPGQYASDGQSIVYAYALITAFYDTKISKVGSDIISEVLEPTVEFITEPYFAFTWGEGGPPLLEPESPGKLVRGISLVRTLHSVTPPLNAALLTLPGCVNNAPYASTLLGLTFTDETLLFVPPTINRTMKSDGTQTCSLQLKFDYKKDGWNKHWRAETGDFEEIYHIINGLHKNHPPADFSPFLF